MLPKESGKIFVIGDAPPEKVLINKGSFNFAESIGLLTQEIGTFSKVSHTTDVQSYMDLKIRAEAAQKRAQESVNDRPTTKEKGSSISITESDGSNKRLENPNSRMRNR